MEFVVTHLTRMEFPNICVAGVDAQSLENVRLVLPYPQTFTCSMHVNKGGPFDLGARLDVGETQARSQPPETEDQQIILRKIRKLGCLSKEDFWKLVANKAQDDIASIFGPTLEKTHQTYSAPEGQGSVSLGFLRPRYTVKLWVREFEQRTKIVLLYQEMGDRLQLPVTDLRLHTHFAAYPVDKAAVFQMNKQLESASSVLLSVGLTRAWSGRHWLQVNNIHISADGSC